MSRLSPRTQLSSRSGHGSSKLSSVNRFRRFMSRKQLLGVSTEPRPVSSYTPKPNWTSRNCCESRLYMYILKSRPKMLMKWTCLSHSEGPLQISAQYSTDPSHINTEAHLKDAPFSIFTSPGGIHMIIRAFVGSQVSVGTLAAQRCPTTDSTLHRSYFDPTSVLLVQDHIHLRSIHT
jgi:hypothetical protein